jgi:translocation and assembly module TamB
MARYLPLSRRATVLSLATLAVAVPVVIFAQDVLKMDNDEQKDWLTSFVEDRLSTPERQIRLSNIDGVLGSDVSVREITISDAEGVWLRVNNVALNWNQAALFMGRLEVRSLKAESIDYLRNAVPAEGAVDLPPAEAGALEVPQFPVAIVLDELTVPSVSFGQSVFGLASQVSLNGGITLDGGNLKTNLDIVRLDGPGGTLDLDVDYKREGNSIDLALALVEPENGVIANLLNIENKPAVSLNIAGAGPVTDLEATLNLDANGQRALSGKADISQQADGIAVAVDLGGPLSTLIAEPYRAFFGAETALTADARLRKEGGLTLTDFRLNGGQLALAASAQTTPDNFLSQLKLDASIADASGTKVTLPVSGSATKLSGAKFAIDFGTSGSDAWTSTLAVDGFETPGFASQKLALNVGGVASDLASPETRRVTFNGDGQLSGISGSDELEAALGDGIGLGLAGMWSAGKPINLAEFRLVGKALTAELRGQIDGLAFKGDIGVETASIAPFSGVAGRDLSGGLSLKASGTVEPLIGGFNLTLDGSGRSLAIDDEVADRILAGNVALSGRIARTETGLEAEKFSLRNNQIKLLANGSYSNALADFTFNFDLTDLALLSDQASGAISVVGTAKGEDTIALSLQGNVPSGTLSGRSLRDARLGFDGQYAVDTLTGKLSGLASLDGFRTTLGADISASPTLQSLANLDFQAGGTRASGGVTRTIETGLMTGGISVVSPDVSVPAALALLDAKGSLNADVTLAPEGGKQGATLRGDIRDLSVNDIEVGAADINASIGDLFGVPAVNGSANASKISAAGLDIAKLTAKANHSGNTTAFDAQASLAIGTDLDVAGSLTPVKDGYRLGLDRLSLAQGALAAKLNAPTVLEVAGSDVRFSAVRLDVGSGSISATGSAGDILNIALDINNLPLNIANTIMPDLGLAGTLNGTAKISGTGSDPQVLFDARADGVNAAAVREFGIAPLSANASGTFRDGTVSLAALTANGQGGLTLSGSGNIPFDGSGLNVALKGSAPLALANQFVADRGGQLSGVVNLDARANGSLDNPQFAGRVTTSGAGYVDPELNLRVTNISGAANLTGTNLVIENLSAGLSTGGTVSASGSIGLTGGMPANVRAAINSARYADGNLFVATVSGDLALTGNLTGSPLLAGNILVENANITVPENFGGGAALIDVTHKNTPAAVEKTLARAKIDERSGAPIPQSRPSGIVLDININAPNQIFIRGRGLDAEVGGSVRIVGPASNIQPVGAFKLNRGRLSILGQRLNFSSGSVTLLGDLDPILDFVATTRGDDITVDVNVKGRASNIEVTFSSNPSFPQDEVLSRLIFNRSMGELSPMQLAKLAGAAAELVGGGGGGLVDGLRGAAGLADLDVVTDKDGNVAVEAGTYLQDNIYLGVQAGASGQNKVTINLDVTDDLKLTGAAGQDGSSKVGVYFERDY